MKKRNYIKCHFKNRIYDKGFEWIDCGNIYLNTIFLPPVKKSNCLIINSKYSKEHIIYPLDMNHSLFRDFSELYPTLNNIKEFAEKYGNIIDEEIEPILQCKTNQSNTSGSYLEFWQKNIIDMYICVFLMDKVLNQDYNFLDSLIEYTKNSIEVLFPIEFLPKWYESFFTENKLFPKSKCEDIILRTSFIPVKKHNKYYRSILFVKKDQNPALFYILEKELENTNSVDIVKQAIINELHQQKKEVKYLATRTAEGIQHENYIVPENLISGMYHQLCNHLLGNQNLRQCPYCKNWFNSIRKNQIYCPKKITVLDEKLGRHISIPSGKNCKQYANKAKKAKVIHLYKTGMSVNQIADKLETRVSQINKWVNELKKY